MRPAEPRLPALLLGMRGDPTGPSGGPPVGCDPLAYAPVPGGRRRDDGSRGDPRRHRVPRRDGALPLARAPRSRAADEPALRPVRPPPSAAARRRVGTGAREHPSAHRPGAARRAIARPSPVRYRRGWPRSSGELRCRRPRRPVRGGRRLRHGVRRHPPPLRGAPATDRRGPGGPMPRGLRPGVAVRREYRRARAGPIDAGRPRWGSGLSAVPEGTDQSRVRSAGSRSPRH